METKLTTLLIAVFFSVAPFILKAQPEEYRSDQGALVGTSDSRMFISIEETENHVEFKVSLLGELTARSLDFILLYDTAKLRLTDETYLYDIPDGFDTKDYGSPVVTIPTSFSSQYPDHFMTARRHSAIYSGDASGMKYFISEMINFLPTSAPIYLNAGEVIHTYSIYCRKVNPGTPLTHSDIGYYAQVQEVAHEPLPVQSPYWTYDATAIRFAKGMPATLFKTKPELFTYRSPSYVITEDAKQISSSTATLNATFTRGDLMPKNDMIVTGYVAAQYYGRLTWDTIAQCGFIYSEQNVDILVNGYSKKLNINGNDYDFPDAAEIAAGEFIRNGNTFYITQADNHTSDQTVAYSQTATDLTIGNTYYIWSFIQYIIETSDTYLYVGNKMVIEVEEKEITIECPLVVDFEGGPYEVTPLAGLCWTSNMATKHYADGNPIAFARAYYSRVYPDSTETASIFGLLYTWYSAVGVQETSSDTPMQNTNGFVQGICPEGWHVPTQAELDKLSKYPVNDLKSTDYWLIPGGTNATGFNALPAGKFNGERSRFEDLYGFTGYWASDAQTELSAHYFAITYYCDAIENKETEKSNGLSVRCVMDY